MKWKVGDRVKAPHGTGTVIGFESFDSKGRGLPHSLVPGTYQNDEMPVSEQRVILRLDPGNRWAFDQRDYACYEREMEEI